MIVFYTKYNVIESFNIQKFFYLVFGCVNGMKNVPDSFKNCIWTGNESGEWRDNRSHMEYEIDWDLNAVAFRVAIVDENDELWTTDIVLHENVHEIQLRLAREKKEVSVEYNRHFNVPYVFKTLIREGIGGNDLGLSVSDKPLFIDEANIEVVADLYAKRKIYSMPIIYVSHPFTGTGYELDVEELAKDMAGSAHVLVEKASKTSPLLKEITGSLNAYNGAIDVFYGSDSYRYLRWSESTPNQYRYKITHAVFSRMAMRNIDEIVSLNAIRIRNKMKKLNTKDQETQELKLRVEELEERCRDSQEYFEYASEEVNNLEKQKNVLENDNHELRLKIEGLLSALSQKQGNGVEAVSLRCHEKPLYDDEIKRILIGSIKKYISSYGTGEQMNRDFHILQSIVENNVCSEVGDKIKEELLRIIRKGKLSRKDVNDLKRLGFEIQQGAHDKFIFNGDDRYIITVSNSPSDHREGENLAHEAINLIFGRS